MEKEFEKKRLGKGILSVAFAYVGIVTGAGLASGRELVQYFLSFGMNGIVAVIICGFLHAIFGKIILSFGSYYRANEHSEVLGEVTHPIINKFLDMSLIITCFVIGFVMIAGAGSNLYQQFNIPPFIGSLICALLTILVCNLDFNKVSNVLGVFTPIIFAFLILALVHSLLNGPHDYNYLNEAALKLPTTLPNVVISLINYFSMCILTGASMGFVLGGEHLNLHIANRGGLLGGVITGLITAMSAFTIFTRVDVVGGADLPMLMLIQEINPILGFIMSLVIFGMIFNTAISLYYAMAKRFAGEDKKRFRLNTVIFVTIGYILSFFGFKELVGVMYPFLGYLGVILLIALLIGYLRNRKHIDSERTVRRNIFRLAYRKFDENRKFTKKDQEVLDRYIDESHIENNELKEKVTEIVKENLENMDDKSQN